MAFISRILLDRHRLRMVTHANRGNRQFHLPTLPEADHRSCPHASSVSRVRSSSLLCNRAILHRPCVVGNPRLLEHVAECVVRHRTKARLIFLLVPRSLGEKQLQFDLADYHSLTVGRSPNTVLSCPALIANRTGKRLWRVPACDLQRDAPECTAKTPRAGKRANDMCFAALAIRERREPLSGEPWDNSPSKRCVPGARRQASGGEPCTARKRSSSRSALSGRSAELTGNAGAAARAVVPWS